MYLEIFLTDFAVFRGFLGNSRDFAEIPEFRRSATARNIRSPVSNNIISNHSFNIAQSALSSGNHFILLSHQKLKSLGYWKRKPNIFYNDVTTNTKHYNCVDYLSFDFLIQLYNISTFSCSGCGL